MRVVAPWVCEDMVDLLASDDVRSVAGGRVTWAQREVRADDLDGAWLVHAATDDSATNADLVRWADARRLFCVNAGAADQGSARTPATTRSGDVLVGVVTDVRAHDAGIDGLPEPSGQGSATRAAHEPAAATRPSAGTRRTPDPRRTVAVRDAIAELLRSGEADQRRHRPGPGRVVLVGGGPGAVDLLTVRGRRELAEADVVVADRLGPTEVLDQLAAGVEVIDVGKVPGNHAVPQHEINAILVEQAQRGRRVVRLKGGDPFVFGRGGEEVVACREAGVPVEVVPGISSSLSVPALAGIPVTHRGTVASFHVTSGHEGLDAASLACVRDRAATLVILMGVSVLGTIVGQLVASGAAPDTPVAVVENGSTPQQRVTRSRLDAVVRTAENVGVRSPAVIVIGDVAADDLLEGVRG
ncbi:uroporphyrinogen-III C-methyltransferase [Paraoerskovia sediminicola]|uniref:uroporphyrinogen-III C-methyltransferase n=1 Tax=Paraoerskovia sediminicola TaxID=1138587 RepID=A0ABN6X9S0_9CELL|nr:uroporphyrinogen-III C-methyltransferase [Paraoerskovia sediminicola]BDZ41484.1 uroporphyrinogen-III C-methyltransferase [Paraoerskovia sediminicola]